MNKQIEIVVRTGGYWVASFCNPPINLIDPQTIAELADIVFELEHDPEVRVIVFESKDPEFFMAHYDVATDKAEAAAMTPGPTGMHPWLDVLVRLSRAPVVSIASIRGRARGAGSEFALACDMRFASAERAVLGQFEVGLGAVPGGNPMVRLSEMVGRGRALEIVLGADDFPGALAERYGYVNRSLPDAELDAFVEQLADRLSRFDKDALVLAKRFVDDYTLPDDAVFPPALDTFFKTVAKPSTRQRTAALLREGLQTRSTVERDLGHAVANCRD